MKRIFPLNQQSLVTSDAKFALNMDKIVENMPLKDVVMAKTSIVDVPVTNQDEIEPISNYVVDRVSVITQEIEQSDNQVVEE